MKNTLILAESKGAAARTREQQEAVKTENEVNLREAIMSAAEAEGLEATPELIAQAKLRFSYSNGKVRPSSIYGEITDFMKRHDHQAPKIKTVTQMVDERAVKKKQLYDELCHYADTGDMKAYRACRAEYAKL